MRGNMKKSTDWIKKRKLARLAALIMAAALGLTACGDGAGSADGSTTENAGDNGTGMGAGGSESSGAGSENDATGDRQGGGNETGGTFGCADDGRVRQELTALEVTELMGNGINLGNTMEAYGRKDLGTEAETARYETFWGQSVTTQEMLDGMKAAGFDTLRLPVAWTNMMAFESGDYTINSAYLDRVEEIAGYARNAGMYVIINDHWDGGWWGMFGSAS